MGGIINPYGPLERQFANMPPRNTPLPLPHIQWFCPVQTTKDQPQPWEDGGKGGSFAMIYLFFLSHKFLSLLHMYSFICCLLPIRMRVRIFVSHVHKTYDQETQNLSAQKKIVQSVRERRKKYFHLRDRESENMLYLNRH